MSEAGSVQIRWLVVAPTGGVSGFMPSGSHVNGLLKEAPIQLEVGGSEISVANT